MKKYTSVILSFLFCSITVCAESKVISVPIWNIGDKWTVRGWYTRVEPDRQHPGKFIQERKGFAVDVPFEVTAIKTIGTQECFEVKMIVPKDGTGFQDRYLAYYTIKEHALIKLINVSIRQDGSIVNAEYDFVFTPDVPISTADVGSFIPFDTPSFRQGQGNKKYIRNERDVEQDVAEKKDKPGNYTIKLKTKDRPKDRVMTQEWEKGLPWWRSCVETRGDEIYQEWELIEPKKK